MTKPVLRCPERREGGSQPKTVIWWVRRDLRLTDNQALHAALSAGERLVRVSICAYRRMVRVTCRVLSPIESQTQASPVRVDR